MKLLILSDLHLEFADFDVPQTDADVVVLAGDIHVGTDGIRWAWERLADIPVIYVPGNHEYYGHALPKLTDKLREFAAGSNVHVLEQDTVEVDGVTFLGCTLWTDFRLFGDPRLAGYAAMQTIRDYQKIRVSPQYRRLRAEDTAAFHWQSRNWLEAALQSTAGDKVIVTHHAPSRRSIAERYKDDILSAAYVTELDELAENSGARAWIHGHLHNASDYTLGTTRVLCNPRGYPDEYIPGFEPDRVVEI